MFKNYFFILKHSLQTLNCMITVFDVNDIHQSRKINSNGLFVLFFLMISTIGYSQTETFQTGIPVGWAIKGAQGTTPPLTETT
jgi:hypothetical protein